ncbi:MAG TPA: hypothetical protein VN513_07660 [Gemmatimonadales bacterium]|nr:hypothetical protein [Gemmatimonadales bacterium]
MKAGPGIRTVSNQMSKKSSGRTLMIAIMRIRPHRVRGTMATRIRVRYDITWAIMTLGAVDPTQPLDRLAISENAVP